MEEENKAPDSRFLKGAMTRNAAKARADGFRELYGWLDQRDVLIVKADRQEALVVVRLSLAVEIAQATNPKRGSYDNQT
jgi:hypothetical protein